MIVYHYCDIDTFYNIITKKAIRLSDVTKSNDYMEVMWVTQYIKDVFMEIFDSVQTRYFKNNYSSEIFEELVEHYQADFFDITKSIYSHYVCCFSAAGGDILSQWRGYADDGKGVAVGFDGDLLSTIGLPAKDDLISSQVLYFWKVEYLENSQKQVVKNAAKKASRRLKANCKKIYYR